MKNDWAGAITVKLWLAAVPGLPPVSDQPPAANVAVT